MSQKELDALCGRIAVAVERAFREVAPSLEGAKVEITLAGKRVLPHNVVVQLRPMQPKAGMNV